MSSHAAIVALLAHLLLLLGAAGTRDRSASSPPRPFPTIRAPRCHGPVFFFLSRMNALSHHWSRSKELTANSSLCSLLFSTEQTSRCALAPSCPLRPPSYAIYYSITTHRWKGKKVSFLSPGDVNPGLIASRWGLLDDSPYRAVGTACLSCDWSRPCT
jgi:hypothetical protein